MEDNSYYMDLKNFNHIIHNKTKGRMRLHLGEFSEEDFKDSVGTIQELDQKDQIKIKEYIKSSIKNK
jgi:hypothetical protein